MALEIDEIQTSNYAAMMVSIQYFSNKKAYAQCYFMKKIDKAQDPCKAQHLEDQGFL